MYLTEKPAFFSISMGILRPCCHPAIDLQQLAANAATNKA
jgi:hypothetical protein